ncbi:MAG: hypothetical protein ACOX5A_02125 [Aminivibrio sp.]|jgi:hypothetical protein
MKKTQKTVWLLVSAAALCILALTVYGRFERVAEGMKKHEEAPGSLRDWSNPDAPKAIESKVLVTFEYDGGTVGYEMCNFRLALEDGAVRCRGWGEGTDGAFQLDFAAPTSSLEALQAVIEEHNLVRHNGIDVFVNGLPPGMGEMLRAEYASGEKIYAANNQFSFLGADEALVIFSFFAQLADGAGCGFYSGEGESSDQD